MKVVKQIVYRYNGDTKSDETEAVDAGFTDPKKDGLVVRKGKRWKVVHVTTEETASGPDRALPVVRVYLADPL